MNESGTSSPDCKYKYMYMLENGAPPDIGRWADVADPIFFQIQLKNSGEKKS